MHFWLSSFSSLGYPQAPLTQTHLSLVGVVPSPALSPHGPAYHPTRIEQPGDVPAFTFQDQYCFDPNGWQAQSY